LVGKANKTKHPTKKGGEKKVQDGRTQLGFKLKGQLGFINPTTLCIIPTPNTGKGSGHIQLTYNFLRKGFENNNNNNNLLSAQLMGLTPQKIHFQNFQSD
jgi:hypothetical protein